MNTRKQIALSLVILAAAGVFVSFQLSGEDDGGSAGGMEGHDHAAMVAGSGQNPVELTPEDARRIGVTFARVVRHPLDVTVQAVGTVAYDETRLSAVNPKIEGWVEELYVDFTGAPVEAGQRLMAIYSPALVSAQEELVLAARLAREAGAARATENAERLLESARRRLAYWDIPEDVIREIEETGRVQRTLVLRAPESGVVVEKNVVQGDRITPGMTLFRIADLDRVWVEADVFEKDLGLVEVGQPAAAELEAFPGRSFDGRVTYVYPTVSMEARTGRVRLELPNPRGMLKPGMYARVTLDVPPTEPALVVPQSALLSTGARSLVFVQSPEGTLLPREVTPGRTAGREVQILEGLEAGERVVSSAAFLVDAESNLGALTEGMEEMGTMDDMDVEGGAPMDHSGHEMPGQEQEADHSGHQMSGDTAGAMDHSNHRP